MNLIFNNQISIFEDIFYKYLTPKQSTKLYTSNLILYNIYLINNKFEDNYFTPKDKIELIEAVHNWCKNREEAILKYGDINYWNTIYITNMNSLFYTEYNEYTGYTISYFNDNISDWNTSNVSNMTSMFINARNFNQDISNWDITNVQSINYMFYSASNFNQNLNNWNIKNVKSINNIFTCAKKFNKENCSKWDLSNIKDINKQYMFDIKL